MQADLPLVSKEVALDWLCSNLPPESMPRTFAVGGSIAASDPVKVIVAAPQQPQPAESGNRLVSCSDMKAIEQQEQFVRSSPFDRNSATRRLAHEVVKGLWHIPFLVSIQQTGVPIV